MLVGELGVVARHDGAIEEGVVRCGLNVLRSVLRGAADCDGTSGVQRQVSDGVLESGTDTLEPDFDGVLYTISVTLNQRRDGEHGWGCRCVTIA